MDQSGGYDEYAFVAEFYDHVVPYRQRHDVTFFVKAAQAAGSPVLEVGCGTGRVLLPTARAGIDVVGLDLSAQMLRVCQGHLLGEPEAVQSRVRLIRADMRHFALHQAFTLVTIPFRPFQHLLTVADQQACLRCMHRHLVADGRLILDVFNPSLETLVRDNLGQEVGEEPEFTLPDGRRVRRQQRHVSRDLWQQIIHIELLYDV